MTLINPKTLLTQLLDCDSESGVIEILEAAGYWNCPACWRYFGDNENNYSTIGNQQSKPDAALVEKIVNSVDAKLMNACLSAGIDAEDSETAPSTIHEAVALFFGGSNFRDGLMGDIGNWPSSKRTEVARGITVSATGMGPRQGKPCITIADDGEGQTPEKMPETLLSLNRSNKLKIPFVQGKFNMGGTGALYFCGKSGLQLILSRRNPALLDPTGPNPDQDKWSFTVVRREDPADGRRSSVYTYLAPLDAEINPKQGRLLRFSGDSLPIFAEKDSAYSRESTHGTLIKLYEYAASGYSNSHILLPDGLLGRLDLLLAKVALPVRLHECRDTYTGHKGSFETTLSGLLVRLADDKQNNLEEDYVSSSTARVAGESLKVTTFVFKKGKDKAYRRHEGVLFVVNGQTHGSFSKDFFKRKKAGRLGYIADSLLLVVDCSDISPRSREDLFLNSRDRLSNSELRQSIESALEELVRDNSKLKELENKRRQEFLDEKLADNKPFEDIIKDVLKSSPSLSRLFNFGNRLSNPFGTIGKQQEEKPFQGKKHPTYFNFKGKGQGYKLERNCHLLSKARIAFETDVENEYFSRSENSGTCSIIATINENPVEVDFIGPNLVNGIGNLTVTLPVEAQVGDRVEYRISVSDNTLIEPFINDFDLLVKPPAQNNTNGSGGRRQPPSDREGGGRDIPTGLQLPEIFQVREDSWEKHGFDRFTALKAISSQGPDDNAGQSERYDFYINLDNIYLRTEVKSIPRNSQLLESQFTYGLVILALGLIREYSVDTNQNGEHQERVSVDEFIELFSKAVAPMITPMINALGNLDLKELELVGE